MKLNWKIVHLTNENIFNDRLDWHRGIPPPPPPPREDGDGEDEEQQIPRIPIDWDFSHMEYSNKSLITMCIYMAALRVLTILPALGEIICVTSLL